MLLHRPPISPWKILDLMFEVLSVSAIMWMSIPLSPSWKLEDYLTACVCKEEET